MVVHGSGSGKGDRAVEPSLPQPAEVSGCVERILSDEGR